MGMGSIGWSELFPSRTSIFIFIGYMTLFISQGILVTASQDQNNSYSYNTVTVVLLTEVLKLIISAILYCKDNPVESLVKNVLNDRKVLLLYFVPAFLYCLYNNLAFINLAAFDPTTYYLLLQFRVVITGILFQVIFKKYLSLKQWLSLILLTIGCMLKQVEFGTSSDLSSELKTLDTSSSLSDQSGIEKSNADHSYLLKKNTSGFTFSINAIFILIQTICSCLAGVYNEYLLKAKGSVDINIYIQNIFMYIDSIVCNLVILLLQGNAFDAFSLTSLKSIFQYNVIIIMLNNAAIGIVTSFFLKYLNSILKSFASALELLFTAILCYFLFSIPIYLNTVLAIGVVSFAIYLYSQSPVVNTATTQTPSTGVRSSFDKSTNSNSEFTRSLLNSQDSYEDEYEDDDDDDDTDDVILQMEKV